MVQHRRWMIRAFAIGVAVGTIRIWLALFLVTGLLDFPSAIGRAFWISLSLHALVAELWLRARPLPPEGTVARLTGLSCGCAVRAGRQGRDGSPYVRFYASSACPRDQSLKGVALFHRNRRHVLHIRLSAVDA
jgi:hypothetical protein